MLKDSVTVTTKVVLELIDQDGNVVARREKSNKVVSAGLALLASRISGSGNALTHVGIGSGSTAPALGDTDLQTPLARRAFDSAGSVVGSTVTFYTTIPAGTGTGTVTEAGLFNAAAAGTMFSRLVIDPVVKTAAMALVVSWAVTFTGN